ncbi:PTS fructose transporter subunit EIIC [Necropsobacter massiliensis]|uniref:PTS fructose transporter subunit EIIC n=1 Tax=Necropsobacter massiliensis TaxID=1400001 RepID=UPI0005961D2F|nr:PTS fructose transporter subunit EIIC [Necropsobacter massiliensis]
MNDLTQILKHTRQHLMTGVSHMIPFVVSGGILLAVAVMLFGQGGVPDVTNDPFLHKLFNIGVAGLTLMTPFLAAYIGYSIAERAALAPCAIAAWVGNSFGAGFFGALFAGLIGGIVVFYLKKIKVPQVLRSVMPIFIIPIIGTFITAGIMMWGLGEPIGYLTTSLTTWLKGMQASGAVILAIITCAMIGFDLGGPVNKVAYAFMLICVGEGIYNIVAAIAIAIAVPAIGAGLATFLAKNLFTADEREAGKAAIIMGCVGISEGAIPFAASDPLRIIPSTMLGAVAGGVVSVLLGAECYAGWGGIIVLPVVTGKLGYLVGMIVGSLVCALSIVILKKLTKNTPLRTDESNDDLNIEFI